MGGHLGPKSLRAGGEVGFQRYGRVVGRAAGTAGQAAGVVQAAPQADGWACAERPTARLSRGPRVWQSQAEGGTGRWGSCRDAGVPHRGAASHRSPWLLGVGSVPGRGLQGGGRAGPQP